MRERDIFIEALNVQSAERAAVLEQACQGDEVLRSRVAQLLAEHERQESFILDVPPAGLDITLDHPQLSESPGKNVGPYKLLQQIGEGGMGVVFMAEQSEPIQRMVALKIIKPGMDTRKVIARFDAERQALAMMDHPNIAKVLDAGTTDSGLPYFVMELVKGVPITQYCDEKHLPLRARLGLLVPVCQAVQHAHQKGLIHRDIKPSNVLVAEYDDHAVPKVIDFGVAKAVAHKLTDQTMFTEFGQVIGTLEYMSPEQAKFNQLDIDTRSDIYSLGVLLYELLTGSTPFGRDRLNAGAFDEMLRVIREEEPPKPSTRLSTTDQLPGIAASRGLEPGKVSGLVRGELDWIVMKALEKDRNRRYETASAFAADVVRYLQNEPVLACPPSATYQFRKFALRNKAVLFALSVVLATLTLLVIGLAVSNQLILAERNEKVVALAEKEKALALVTAEGERAEENFLRASIAIREVLTKAAMGLDEWSALPMPLRKRFSEEAVSFYQSLAQEDSVNSNRRYEAAVGYRSIGSLHVTAGELQEAEEYFRRSIAVLAEIVQNHPTVPQYRHQLAWSHLLLSRMLASHAERREEAMAEAHRARHLYEGLLSASGAPRVAVALSARRAADDSTDKVFNIERLAICHADLAMLASNEDQLLEADKWYNQALDTWAMQPEGTPMTVGLRWTLAHARRVYAFSLQRAGHLDEAEVPLADALGVFRELMSENPEKVDNWTFTADTHRKIAELRLLRGHYELAARSLGQCIEIHEQCSAKFPNYLVNKGDHAASLNELAWILANSPVLPQRDPAQAILLAQSAVAIEPEGGGNYRTLGLAQYRAGKWQLAIESLEQSMKLLHGGDGFDWFILSMANQKLGNMSEARKWYDQAVNWTEKNRPKDIELRRMRTETEDLLAITLKTPLTNGRKG